METPPKTLPQTDLNAQEPVKIVEPSDTKKEVLPAPDGKPQETLSENEQVSRLVDSLTYTLNDGINQSLPAQNIDEKKLADMEKRRSVLRNELSLPENQQNPQKLRKLRDDVYTLFDEVRRQAWSKSYTDFEKRNIGTARNEEQLSPISELPPEENKGNSTKQNSGQEEISARKMEPESDSIANPAEIIKRATEDNLKRGINIAEMIKNQTGNQETSPSDMRSAVEEITSELLAEHAEIIGEQNEKIVRKFLETKVNGELTAKLFETFRSKHGILGALLLPGFELHWAEQKLKEGWNNWQMNKLVKEGKLSQEQLQKIQNIPILADNESAPAEKEKKVAKNERKNTLESSSFYVREKSRANKDHLERNEDSILNMPEKGVFMISDGMGGHAAGEVASRIATDTARELFSAMPENLSLEEAKELVKTVLLTAHERILEKMATDESLKGMGATATVLLHWTGQNGEQKMITGNVGDSRSYLLRDNKLNQLTLDDNEFIKTIRGYVTQDDAQIRKIQKAASNLPYEATDEELIREIRTEGLKLSAEQEETLATAFLDHNNEGELIRERLFQALGHMPGQKIDPQISAEDVRRGDVFFMNSDGGSDNIFEKDMEQFLLAHKDDPDAMEKFAELAYNSGRKLDDISAMVIEINQK